VPAEGVPAASVQSPGSKQEPLFLLSYPTVRKEEVEEADMMALMLEVVSQ
jgi:hypothetical protein